MAAAPSGGSTLEVGGAERSYVGSATVMHVITTFLNILLTDIGILRVTSDIDALCRGICKLFSAWVEGPQLVGGATLC